MFNDRSGLVGEAKDMTTWDKSNPAGKGSQDDQLGWMRQGLSGGQMGIALDSAAQPESDQQGSSNRTLGSWNGTTAMLSSHRLPHLLALGCRAWLPMSSCLCKAIIIPSMIASYGGLCCRGYLCSSSRCCSS